MTNIQCKCKLQYRQEQKNELDRYTTRENYSQ
jgi:hypothetical protein